MGTRTFTSSAARSAALSAALLIGASFLSPAGAAVVCEELTKATIHNGRVTSSMTVPAGSFSPGGRGGATPAYSDLPAFCRVMLTLTPSSDSDIKVEIWLPAEKWNGRYQAVGQGGMAGSIPYALMAPAVHAGYATSGTDTGHVGNNADFMPAHPEKLVDFAYRAVHEMAVASKAVIETHFGARPTRSYFNGCSGGGRHGLTSAQRYPQDFDGIVAGAASWNSTRLDAARIALNQFVNRSPDAAIPAGKYPMIHNAVIAACDGRDGVRDGVIENPMACGFDYGSLACKGGDGPSCLTPAQVESAKALTTPLRHPKTGAVLFEGHLWPGSELEWDTLAGPDPLDNALTRLGNIAFKNPGWNPREFTIDDVDRVDRLDNGLLASRNFDLRPFFSRGGKLIVWHGWSDPQVTPQNSIMYYQNVLKTVGSDAERSIALFMLPGVSHCTGGPGPDSFDRMAAIEQWVEQGRKPSRLVVSKIESGTVVRTRPLCPFGQVARFNGGDANDAASFACVAAPAPSRP